MIKAEVKYTEDHYRQLAKCRNKILLYICTATAGVNVLLFLGLVFLSKFTKEGAPKDLADSAVPLIILIAFIVLDYLYMYVIAPKRAAKTERKKFGDEKVCFTFTEEKMTARHKGADFSDSMELSYDKLDKAVETDGYFLLYLRASTAFIIGRGEITEGSPDQLRALLKNKFGTRYKKK
ncbi:MAG: YcxB family protein [Ruminococcus sp.]|nr:YcxB family protein [Ruminococcus sp.]